MSIELADTVVLGGGLIGHLAGVLFPQAVVIDRRAVPSKLGVTHQPGAHYLWEPLQGLTCHSIRVFTRIDDAIATPEGIAAYKAKVLEPMPSATRANGEPSYRLQQFNPEMVGWRAELPPVDVRWNHQALWIDVEARMIQFDQQPMVHYRRLISTIPLRSLLELAVGFRPLGGHPHTFELVNRPVYVQTFKNGAPPFDFGAEETLYVNYVTDPALPYYRETHQEDGTIQREGLTPYCDGMFRVVPGKLVAHSDVPAMLAELQHAGIYCFGHYGTWDPDELTHHTWYKMRAMAYEARA